MTSETKSRPPLMWRGLTRRYELLLAALLAMLAYAAVSLVLGLYPLGERTNQLNDLGAQVVPFMAEYRRMLLGQAPLTDLTWTWTLGMGTPFLGTFTTYLANPLNALVVLFPEHLIEAAVWTVALVHHGLAALTCGWLLRTMRPKGSTLLLIGVALSYSMCGWAINDADYMSMWLAGWVMLPVLVRQGWVAVIKGRGFVVGALLVALTWLANYYSAMMACIGAGVIVVILAVAEAPDLKRGIRGVARFAAQGVVGTLCAGLVLLTTLGEINASLFQPGDEFQRVEWQTLFGHLLPMTESAGDAPSFYVGSLVLVLAALALFQRDVTWRWRAAWALGLGGLLVSFKSVLGLSVWNGFEPPNGGVWRAAFVLALALCVVAWCGVARLCRIHWLGWVAVPVAVGVPLYSSLTAKTTRVFDPVGVVFVAGVAALLLAAWLLRRWQGWLAGAAVALTAVELVVSSAFTVEKTHVLLSATPVQSQSIADFVPQREATIERAGWPTRRVGQLPDLGVAKRYSYYIVNEAALLGVPSISYYSSLVPQQTGTLLNSTIEARHGRMARIITYYSDPVVDAILAVGADLATGELRERASLPMVREAVPVEREHDGDDLPAYLVTRDAFFTGTLYSRAETSGEIPGPRTDDGLVQLRDGDKFSVGATCPAGQHVVVDGTTLDGTLEVHNVTYHVPQVVWTAPETSTGQQTWLHVTVTRDSWVSPRIFYCLDPAPLQRTIAATATPRIELSPGTVVARFADPLAEPAVIATAPVNGWRCTADGEPVPMTSFNGLMAVNSPGAREIRCDYRPPGLGKGLAVSGLGFLILAGVAAWPPVRRRWLARGGRPE